MEACLYIGGGYLAQNKNWEGKKIQNYFTNGTVTEKKTNTLWLRCYDYVVTDH